MAIEKELPERSARLRAFRVPGYGPPIYLRDCVADHATFRQCFVKQQYDFRVFPQYERLSREYTRAVRARHAPLIIDGGANIGLATRWFATHFPEAKIVAVEPDPANFAV